MRIQTLDYLRGLMALGILVYHYFSWTFHPYESDTFLGIIGIYGVSIFYILSGLTLYIVYNNKLYLSNLPSFLVKRLIRILPLLWLSIFLNMFLLGQSYNIKTLMLNITGLFGFFDHNNYIATGSWSIGNELVFYSIFPIIIIMSYWKRYILEIFFGLSLILASYFAFIELDGYNTLSSKWSEYINPFNQVFLFIGGMLIGAKIKSNSKNLLSLALLFISVAFIIFYTIIGDKIYLVSGWNRFLYSLVSFIVVIAFFIFKVRKIPKVIDWILSQLGHISYSLYLLHAIVFTFIARHIDRTESPIIFLSLCLFITFIVSYLSYTYIEVTFLNIGRRMLNHNKSKK